jgi:hypothetical protein
MTQLKDRAGGVVRDATPFERDMPVTDVLRRLATPSATRGKTRKPVLLLSGCYRHQDNEDHAYLARHPVYQRLSAFWIADPDKNQLVTQEPLLRKLTGCQHLPVTDNRSNSMLLGKTKAQILMDAVREIRRTHGQRRESQHIGGPVYFEQHSDDETGNLRVRENDTESVSESSVMMDEGSPANNYPLTRRDVGREWQADHHTTPHPPPPPSCDGGHKERAQPPHRSDSGFSSTNPASQPGSRTNSSPGEEEEEEESASIPFLPPESVVDCDDSMSQAFENFNRTSAWPSNSSNAASSLPYTSRR